MKKVTKQYSLTKKIIFSLIAILWFILILELCLQGAGFVLQRLSKPELKSGRKGIVCVGDSHTYGVFVAKEEAYPFQLEQLLNKNSNKYQVINLGAPGINSSQILRDLNGIIKDYHPLAVVVLVGINNGWNIACQGIGFRQTALMKLKLYKMGRFIYFQYFKKDKSYMVVKPRDKKERIYHIERKELPEEDAELRAIQRIFIQDLMNIIKLCQENDVKIVLMNYAGDKEFNYFIPNQLTQQVAEKTGVPMMDNYSYFLSQLYNSEGILNQELHKKLFLKDMHLSPLGYRIMAENLYKTLIENGIVE